MNKEKEKVMVCPNCGKNGDEVLISIGARIYGVIDKYGNIEWDSTHSKISDEGLHEIVCICQDECGTESGELITDDEYKNNLSND